MSVPPNMTKHYQPLDLTVSWHCKQYIGKMFNDWYTSEVFNQLDEDKHIDLVDVNVLLSVLKPLHAGWLVEFYNHMTTGEGRENILSGQRASGIADAVRLGTKN